MKRTVLLALTLLFWASAAPALEPTAVPDFTALSRWGTLVESRALVAEAEARGPAGEQWALLYVPLRWNGWPGLIQALERAGARASERMTVVVGGAALEDLRSLASRTEKAPGVEWLADGNGEALKALPPTALPVAFGVRGWAIEWASLLGGKDPEELASLVAVWVGR